MFWASYQLAALAVVLAWPAPILLSRALWPQRSPFTAMVLWQAIALAGGLSMIGAMLVWGLEPLGDSLLEALAALWDIAVYNRSAESLGLLHVFALSAACLLSFHLVFTLMLTFYRIRAQRRRHRQMLNLLSSPLPDRPSTLMISHPTPVAYCLPGGARSVTVLSDGLLGLLDLDELDAVMRHETAHLAQRHHLLLWAFAAWRSALPWLPTSRLAQRAVNQLIEMLADDVALRTVDAQTLARAIVVVASGKGTPRLEGVSDPSDGLGSGDQSVVQRVQRLLTPLPPLGSGARGLALAASALLLAVPTVLLVAPGLTA